MKIERVMITVGLIWLFIWCLCGFYLGILHEPYLNQMESLAEAGNLTGFWSAFSSWKANTVTHAHGIGFSFILLLVGLAMPHIRFGDKLKFIFGTVLMVGVVIAPVFEWFQIIPAMVIGEVLIIAMVLASLIGALRMLWVKEG